MLSPSWALLESSFFIKVSTSVGRIMGGALSIPSLCGCYGSAVSTGSLLDLYSSWENSTQCVTIQSLLWIQMSSSSMMDMSWFLPRHWLHLACFRLLLFLMAFRTCFSSKTRCHPSFPTWWPCRFQCVWGCLKQYYLSLSLFSSPIGFLSWLIPCLVFALVSACY